MPLKVAPYISLGAGIHRTNHAVLLTLASHGDRLTDEKYKDKYCTAVLRPDGKCIRGRNGNMLVTFNDTKVVVMARLLRKVPG